MAKNSDQPSEAPIATCHCGRVALRLPHAPAEVVRCNCSLCSRYGVLWAYYEVSEIENLPEAGTTDSYAWNGKHVDFHRCGHCGCVTHWAPRAASRTVYGINARLLPPTMLATARIKLKDGAGTGQFIA